MTYFTEKTFNSSSFNEDKCFEKVQIIIGDVILDQILADRPEVPEVPEVHHIDLPDPVETPQPQPVEVNQPPDRPFENRQNRPFENRPNNNFNFNFGFNLDINHCMNFFIYYKYQILFGVGSTCILIATLLFLKNFDLSDFFISKSNKTLDEEKSLINEDLKSFKNFNFQEKSNVLKNLNLKKISLKLKKKS